VEKHNKQPYYQKINIKAKFLISGEYLFIYKIY